jgi:hypothetical protein
MRYLYAVFGILSNKRQHGLHTADVNSSWATGNEKLVCQMCANSAKVSYIRLCITEAAIFTIY